jgi:response regulator NasT
LTYLGWKVTEQEPSTTPTASPRRVVVAEDESLIRLDIVEILRDNGFDVVGEAGDGETAVQLATELRPDLVIMDVKMPVLDGISAAEKLSKNHVAPVVLLTAFSQKELVERASEAGALAYVVKPFTPTTCCPAIEIALARYEQIITLEAEVADMVERFETRKLVDRAKGLLNEKMGLSEPEAFRWIQKASMDRRLTMQDVAKAIIEQLSPKKGLTRASRRGRAGSGGERSLIMFVMRIVEQRRPDRRSRRSRAPSARPRWTGVQTPVTMPLVAERVWVALMSTPTASRPGPACRFAAIAERLAEHDVGAAVHQPDGLGVALDRHRRDGALDRELRELDAHLLGERAHSALRAQSMPSSTGVLSGHRPPSDDRVGSSVSAPRLGCRVTDSAKPTLLVVDGHSLAYRAFFALPVDNFSTKDGQHTNGIYGFLSMFVNLVKAEQPTHLAVAFDTSRHSFRTDEYPEYKANRSESPAEFKGQIPLLQDCLAAMNVTVLTKEGIEADDILATLATQGAARASTSSSAPATATPSSSSPTR